MAAEDPTRKLAELIVLAQQDEPTALKGIRVLFDEHPDLWQSYGDLARRAELALADLIANGDLALKEALLRQAEQKRAELAGGDATPLEELLASSITGAWLEEAHARLAAAGARALTLGQAEFLQRRQDHAQRRLLAAVKMLALIRKLLRPPLAPLEIARRLGGAGAPRAAPATGGRRPSRAAAGTAN
jgi:hypothetical protein